MILKIEKWEALPVRVPITDPAPMYSYSPGHVHATLELELEPENAKEQLEQFFEALEALPSLKILNKEDILPPKTKQKTEREREPAEDTPNPMTTFPIIKLPKDKLIELTGRDDWNWATQDKDRTTVHLWATPRPPNAIASYWDYTPRTQERAIVGGDRFPEIKEAFKNKPWKERIVSITVKDIPNPTLLEAANGHFGPDQQRIAQEVIKWGDLLLRKNRDYGSAVWKTPVLAPDCDPGVAIRVRMSDKISRLSTLLTKGDAQVDESVEDTLRDLGSYCLLELARPKNESNNSQD